MFAAGDTGRGVIEAGGGVPDDPEWLAGFGVVESEVEARRPGLNGFLQKPAVLLRYQGSEGDPWDDAAGARSPSSAAPAAVLRAAEQGTVWAATRLIRLNGQL
jgi:hypothetical protein